MLPLVNDWKSRSLDFIPASPQADSESNMFTELKCGIEMRHVNGNLHVLKLKETSTGTQAGSVWNHVLHTKLTDFEYTYVKDYGCRYYHLTMIKSPSTSVNCNKPTMASKIRVE